MNRIEFIELVQQHHSHMGETEILKLVNRALDDFTAETEILRRYVDIGDTVAGQRYYPSYTVDAALNTNAINGNSDIIKIFNVWLDDVLIPRLTTKNAAMLIDDDEFQVPDNALANPTATSNKRYWYPIDNLNGVQLGLVEESLRAVTRDDKVSNFQSISETGLQIRLHYIARCVHLTASSTSGTTFTPQIHSRFHSAIASKAIADGYKDPRNMKLDAAQYFDSEYERAIKKAKKQARNNHTSTGFVAPCDY